MSSSRSIFVRFFPLPLPPLLFFFIQFLFFTSHVLNFLFLFPIPLVIHFLLRSHVSFLLSLRVLPFAIAFILYGVCSTVYSYFILFFFFLCIRTDFLFFSFALTFENFDFSHASLKICEKETLFISHFIFSFLSRQKKNFSDLIVEINFSYFLYFHWFLYSKGSNTENCLNIGIINLQSYIVIETWCKNGISFLFKRIKWILLNVKVKRSRFQFQLV